MNLEPHKVPIFAYQIICITIAVIAVLWNRLNETHRNQGGNRDE
jgi:hypothetical protein